VCAVVEPELDTLQHARVNGTQCTVSRTNTDRLIGGELVSAVTTRPLVVLLRCPFFVDTVTITCDRQLCELFTDQCTRARWCTCFGHVCFLKRVAFVWSRSRSDFKFVYEPLSGEILFVFKHESELSPNSNSRAVQYNTIPQTLTVYYCLHSHSFPQPHQPLGGGFDGRAKSSTRFFVPTPPKTCSIRSYVSFGLALCLPRA
jgi:hypothetical protein